MADRLDFSILELRNDEWSAYAAVPVTELRAEGISYSTEWYLRTMFRVVWEDSDILDVGYWDVGLIDIPLTLWQAVQRRNEGQEYVWVARRYHSRHPSWQPDEANQGPLRG